MAERTRRGDGSPYLPLQLGCLAVTFIGIAAAAFVPPPLPVLVAGAALICATGLLLLQRNRAHTEKKREEQILTDLRRKNEETTSLLARLVPALEYLATLDEAAVAAVGASRAAVSFPASDKPPEERARIFSASFSPPKDDTQEKLRRLRGLEESATTLQEVELRLPYIDEILKRVVDHTERAASKLIDRFSSISELTGQADQEAKNAIEALSGGSDADEGLEALIRKSHESVVGRTTVINDFLRLNRENADRLKRIADLLTKSEELIVGIEDIAERSKLIAFNMAVESAKIGDKGRGFKVIVNELQRLNDQTTRFAQDIMGIFKSFRVYNQELLDQWVRKAETLTVRVRDDSDQAEFAVSALARSYDASGTLFRSLSESAMEVNRAMGDILESLQFQDITRQQIEGAESFIHEIGIALRALRKTYQTLGYALGDEGKLRREIRKIHEPQMKVSKDHDIFEQIERRSR